MDSHSAYQDFRTRLDTATAKAWERDKSKMACKAGCSMCCRDDFKIGLVEGIVVTKALNALPHKTQQVIKNNLAQGTTGRCPLLINDQCSIYENRPSLCRIFGFLVAADGNVTTCELNFTEEQEAGYGEFSAHAFDRNAIGQALWEIDKLFLAETGQTLATDQPPPRFTIRELLGEELA